MKRYEVNVITSTLDSGSYSNVNCPICCSIVMQLPTQMETSSEQ